MRFRDIVLKEFSRRQQQNPRYSLRGFARALRVHHSTLSRLINGTTPLTSPAITLLGSRLGLSEEEIRDFVLREDTERVRAAIARPTFRPQSRWLASVAGISIDRVNVALQALLRTRRVRMVTGQWLLTNDKGAE